ncbi:hypothetical protein L915_13322 [Phytophthora nicotianae]|uniref:Uncharacterized protein n=2 Tax=Phytophthora nicotianae TaxID=4792 RepID=W2GDT4_PHYNI|nr:hypothetical protein L915_13322 [Phytophthora nicotianae]ETO69759.1 hypothetical protein F444_13714 [Phytophthora nicotianae P1976]
MIKKDLICYRRVKVATIKTGENVQFDFDVAHPPA